MTPEETKQWIWSRCTRCDKCLLWDGCSPTAKSSLFPLKTELLEAGMWLFLHRLVSRLSRILAGAQQCAARGLHRPAQERPACERPTRGRPSVDVATWARDRANVTGNSARTDGLHPSGHLGCIAQKRQTAGDGDLHGHPAAAMEAQCS